ncbi:hypothetical protein [Pseudolysinimonas sp.]|uniref:hypothetical protein n=1 Tax=Pseudolysinimonas sp. TaxID=2680009 RepID=UPI00286BCE2A|nr:hypothetical protein [Pseudolysinimonas sp.]
MSARVIDYSALTTTPTPEEVAEYRTQARASGATWANTTTQTIIAIVIASVVGAAVLIPMMGGILVFLIGGLEGGNPIAAAFLLFFVFALGLVGFAIVRVAIAGNGRWGRWLRMDRFARANGFTFSPADPNPGYPGAIFQVGDSRQATEHFRTVEGRFLDFGNYQYSTGSGKNRSTRAWGFLAIELDRKLPHMVLDSKANNGLFGGTNLPAQFDKDQILSLEGDFDRFFTLYCPKAYERDALYVFTPDLMTLLIDNAAPFDVEIVDDWMFVYSATPFPTANPAVYQRLLRIVQTVGAKTLTQTDRYQDDRAAAPFASNIVTPQGARLKRGVSVGAIILIVATALIWGWSFFADMMTSLSGG